MVEGHGILRRARWSCLGANVGGVVVHLAPPFAPTTRKFRSLAVTTSLAECFLLCFAAWTRSGKAGFRRACISHGLASGSLRLIQDLVDELIH